MPGRVGVQPRFSERGAVGGNRVIGPAVSVRRNTDFVTRDRAAPGIRRRIPRHENGRISVRHAFQVRHRSGRSGGQGWRTDDGPGGEPEARRGVTSHEGECGGMGSRLQEHPGARTNRRLAQHSNTRRNIRSSALHPGNRPRPARLHRGLPCVARTRRGCQLRSRVRGRFAHLGPVTGGSGIHALTSGGQQECLAERSGSHDTRGRARQQEPHTQYRETS